MNFKKKFFPIISGIIILSLLISSFPAFASNENNQSCTQNSSQETQTTAVSSYSNQWFACTYRKISEPEDEEHGQAAIVSVLPVFNQESACYGLFVLPDKIEQDGQIYDVTQIDMGAFADCNVIKKLYIPSTVTEIDTNLFGSESNTYQNVVIYCSENSKAEQFAKDNHLTASPVSLSFETDKISLMVGESYDLSVSVPDFISALETEIGSSLVDFSSSDEQILSVSSDGLIQTLSAVSSGTAAITASFEGLSCQMSCEVTQVMPAGLTLATVSNSNVGVTNSNPSVTYRSHVQNIGWQNDVADGECSGTTGQSLRVEALKVTLDDVSVQSGSNLQVETHVANIGWMSAVGSGEIAGTTGRSLAVEAVKIRLTGDLADQYDIYYCVHAANIGWMGWAKNGASAGTEGYAYRIEAIKIVLLPKGQEPQKLVDGKAFKSVYGTGLVNYSAHVQNIGWQNYTSDGDCSGTTGQSLRIEALKVRLDDTLLQSGNIQIESHVSNIGWMSAVASGETAGTTGRSLAVEAVRIRLTGDLADQYDIYYCVHAANIGWMGWAKDGGSAGTEGYAYRIEAIKIVLLPKGQEPQKLVDGKAFKSVYGTGLVNYSAHVQNIGWQNYVSDGERAGTTGQALQMEALKIRLDDALIQDGSNIQVKAHVANVGWMSAVGSGEIAGTTGKSQAIEAIQISLNGSIAFDYDVYYCLYVQNYGWLDWACNGAKAGTCGLSYRAEAIKIILLEKGKLPEGSTERPYIDAAYLKQHTSLNYSGYLEKTGWQTTVTQGETAGTTDGSLGMEAMRISLSGFPEASIRYRAHVQNVGWQDYVYDGTVSGTTDQNLRLEAIQIDLVNLAQNIYDVYYRCYIEEYGWLDWACNGETAGSCGASLKMKAIEIVLVEKGGNAPGSTARPCYDVSAGGRLVSVALNEVGYAQDTTTGYTKYGAWYSGQVGNSVFTNSAWCAMFVSWCANQAGISGNDVPCFAWVPTGFYFYKNTGRWHTSNYVPKTGDIIFFEWDANMSAIGDHVGIVQKVSNGRVYTIEGNSGNSDYGNNGVVRQKNYSLLYNCILGYGSYQ